MVDKVYMPPRDAKADDLGAEFQRMVLDIANLSLQNRSVSSSALVVDGKEYPLPSQLVSLLKEAATALEKGLAVSLIPYNKKVSTQEAADFLGISRPTLIRLLKEGKIPYEKINRHRKLFFKDVVEYQKRHRHEARELLDDMVSDSQLLGDYDAAPEEIAEILKTVRKGNR